MQPGIMVIIKAIRKSRPIYCIDRLPFSPDEVHTPPFLSLSIALQLKAL